jgi:glucosyl-3-phosphoglycerate synthase
VGTAFGGAASPPPAEIGDDQTVGTTGRRPFHHSDFDGAALAAVRGGRTISVCLPARDEEATVGAIVSEVCRALTAGGGGVDLVDEVVVVDDGSEDATAEKAEAAGARVVAAGETGGGKGQALLVALEEARGDFLVFLDADVENFSAHFVTGLLGPLLTDDDVALVKGFYERPIDGAASGGGRVTELVARPIIDLLFPLLAGIRQPLAGETAAPRAVLEKTGLDPYYGIELGLLIDVADRFGVEAVAQVDLGVRVHRNRPLAELRREATDVLHAALGRAFPLAGAPDGAEHPPGGGPVQR